MSLTTLQKLLTVLAVALLGALGWATDWGQGLAEPDVNLRAPNAKPDGAAVLPDFKLSADASAYAQIAERPLLNPTRRPAPTQAAVAVAPEPPKPQIRRGLYEVIGVIDAGNAPYAQLREKETNRVRSVRVGDTLNELSVRSIGANRVVLAFAGETDELELPQFTASGRVPQRPAPAPPAPPSAPQATAPPPSAAPPVVSPQLAVTPPAAPVPAAGRDVNALISERPLPNGMPHTTANADAFIEARRRARFGQTQ